MKTIITMICVFFFTTSFSQNYFNEMILNEDQLNIDFFIKNNCTSLTTSMLEIDTTKKDTLFVRNEYSYFLSEKKDMLFFYYYKKNGKKIDYKSAEYYKQDSMKNLYPVDKSGKAIYLNNYFFDNNNRLEKFNSLNYFYNFNGQLEMTVTDTMKFSMNKPFRLTKYFYSSDTLIEKREFIYEHGKISDSTSRKYSYNNNGDIYLIKIVPYSSTQNTNPKVYIQKVYINKSKRYIDFMHYEGGSWYSIFREKLE